MVYLVPMLTAFQGHQWTFVLYLEELKKFKVINADMVPYHRGTLGRYGLTTLPTFQRQADRSAVCQCFCCSRVESRRVESLKTAVEKRR